MANSEFEKNSMGWQLSQLQQQAGEWLELQTMRLNKNIPQLPEGIPSWLVEGFKAIAWIAAFALLLWLVRYVWRRLEPYFIELKTRRAVGGKTTSRTSEMPVEAWLKRSQTYFDRGNYREACRCLYMAMLQLLHERAIVRHQPSRTDREYWQLVQQLPQSQSYRTLITTHEQLCFSNGEVLSETFERCQQAYRDIARQE
ncbi:DUF4129 domain-containing protein [Chroococcidiopsis sp. FACHB-1243]|uniref:DUF4129 domain-containing protein n=1 Tax=Chroococcidiopsis sp. [FACHB-1243] TaxID=2692781 RepID=UPI00177C2367|nr:DUF4129 domain-containing protein [Chroococcidiopsis sp. [FACHB-1243]]MBD2308616.1 DUF4129 domain-containing protein [Chroococcidiopsis sp. [FACHB-1243]]